MNCIRLALIAGMATATLASAALASSATYTYDALGRVTQVTYDSGTTIVYTYDPATNRTTQTITCGSLGCSQ
jgi:YD repeat-containing protein